MEPILDPGLLLIQFLQGLGDWLALPMQWFTMLGNEIFFLIAAPVLYWCVDAGLGLRLGLILMLSNSLCGIFKIILHSPRPYWYSTQVSALSAETSFGVPSGHAMNAASVWGLLAAWLKSRLAWLAAGVVIFLIGLSRLVLGVHFPGDVVAGWLLGFLLLWAYLKMELRVRSRLASLSPGARILIALAASLGLILLFGLARLSLGAWAVPAAWIENARLATGISEPIDPLSLAGIVANAGTLFGLAAGAVALALTGGFDAGGVAWKRGARFLVGVAGVLLFWRGLGAALPEGEAALSLFLRWARYALVGFWVTGLGPWVFIRLGLANRKTT